MAEAKDTDATEEKPAAKKAAATKRKPAAKKTPAKKPAAKKAEPKKPAAKKEAPKQEAAPKAKAKPAAEPKAPEIPKVRATARYVRVAPRKARLVADQVRGMPVGEAQTLLAFSARGAATDIGKLLASATANAENNHDLVADDLEIAELRVDEGPTLKRWRPRARGRATRIDKKTSHMSVVLTPTAE